MHKTFKEFYLQEAFKSSLEYEYDENNPSNCISAEARMPNGRKLSMSIYVKPFYGYTEDSSFYDFWSDKKFSNVTVEIEFNIDGKHDLTGNGEDVFLMFGTVFKFLKENLPRVNPLFAFFTSKGDSRTSLYYRMIKKNFREGVLCTEEARKFARVFKSNDTFMKHKFGQGEFDAYKSVNDLYEALKYMHELHYAGSVYPFVLCFDVDIKEVFARAEKMINDLGD